MASRKEIVKNVKDIKNNVGTKMKKVKVIDEFTNFIARGNVLDLAVGVLIGGAFQNLVTSLTDNLISPILGCFGEVDFSEYALKIGNLNLKYGAFITDVINFIIMAFVIFLIIKFVNGLLLKEEKKEEEVKPVKSDEVKLLEEICDILKKKDKK